MSRSTRRRRGVADLPAPLLTVVDRYAMAGYVPVVHQGPCLEDELEAAERELHGRLSSAGRHKANGGRMVSVEDTEFPEETYDAFTYQTFTKDENARYGAGAHESNTRLEGKWRHTSILPTDLPDPHMYVLAHDHLWYLSLRPKGVGEVLCGFGVALAPEVHAALGDGRDAWVTELVDFFDRVNARTRSWSKASSRAPRRHWRRGDR